jgi:hypothetical protein
MGRRRGNLVYIHAFVGACRPIVLDHLRMSAFDGRKGRQSLPVTGCGYPA